MPRRLLLIGGGIVVIAAIVLTLGLPRVLSYWHDRTTTDQQSGEVYLRSPEHTKLYKAAQL